MHLHESRTSKFSGGACPRTPRGSKTLRAFGRYTRMLLLSTHLCKNLLKPLSFQMGFLLTPPLPKFAHPYCPSPPWFPYTEYRYLS